MFCSSCGSSSLPEARFCHKCGCKLNELGVETNNANSSVTGGTATLSFKQFQARKENDRTRYFKNKGSKKIKLDQKQDTDSELVKISIGVMTMKDGSLSIKRGLTLPLTVKHRITAEELLEKAVEKHSRFNKDVIKSSNKAGYKLLYGDKNEIQNLPGSDEPFTLKRYKEEIDKPYCRITFYLCSSSDFLESICSNLDFESDSDESNDTQLECKMVPPLNSLETTSPTTSVDQSPEPGNGKPKPIVVEANNACRPTTSLEKEVQCPICCLKFPVQTIEQHVDDCSAWLLESEQPLEALNNNEAEDEENSADCVQGAAQIKNVLKEQIAGMVSGSLTELRRISLRRRFMWMDFKAARQSKIQPSTPLKVVFVGEPSVDDGGPKRELFTELLAIIQRKFFQNGYPINSSVALSNEDFLLCGEIMAMSILQSGPAPNFLAQQIVHYLIGEPLSIQDNKDTKLKIASCQLHNATSDEQVRELLVSDSVLDVLEEIGYTGIPQRETLSSVKDIIQSICMKDQMTTYLPALLQIQNGLQTCGLLKTMRSHPHIWGPVFQSGSSIFNITADEFLEGLDVQYSTTQLAKNAEVDTFKCFCDVIEKIDADIGRLELRDIIKWLTGSYDIPPLGFPKKFHVAFVHGCSAGCSCRPTASTCDITIKLPVHINDDKLMEEMMYSAIKESHGFGLL